MAKYAVEIKPHARKELEPNPRPPGCKKLQGGENKWRIRIGDYRVVSTIDDERP